MSKLAPDTVERIYAGWYGKLIGIRHGSNIENWPAEKIAERYGEITGYLFDFKHFAADDDSNGPLFFLRALDDYGLHPTTQQLGETLLNYAPFERGFFWWGGYGRSTEHTAYLNLAAGIPAPHSGSIALNGAAAAEQIGGQIFVDTWGLVNPGDYKRAAEYAGRMASVTHDGNGVYGGMFVAACVSAAFEERDMERVVAKGLSVIPAQCAYRRMAEDVIAHCRAHPGDWRASFRFVQEHYGYDRYPGACHIIPNGAVVVLSLIHGAGDFSRTVNICNMCGWDTDCNVANAGCITGVLVGLDGIDESWRRPINDFLACASTLCCMNGRDVANDALHFAALAYRLAGEEFPERYRPMLEGRAPRYSFELPGSTHTFEAVGAVLENCGEAAKTGTRSLKITGRGTAQVSMITYYRPEDFTDDRYTPSFAPYVFPGQTVSAALRAGMGAPTARLWAEDCDGRRIWSGARALTADAWAELEVQLPAGSDLCIRRVGVELACEGPFTAYLDAVDFGGRADYVLDFAKSGIEQWDYHYDVGQCSRFKGMWRLEDGLLHGSCADRGELYTGGRDWADYTYCADLTPVFGEEHFLLFRVQGAVRCYAAGLAADGRLVLRKNENGYRELAGCPFPWARGKTYPLSVTVRGGEIAVSCGGEELIRFTDEEAPYLTGAVGAGVFRGSHCSYGPFAVREL